MRCLAFILTGLSLIGSGCKHGLLRKPCKDDECAPARRADDGVRLGEPVPGRIAPSNVPLRPDDTPPPSFDSERRFRTQPPPASIPLPGESESRNTAKSQPRDRWLEDPIAPNGFRLPGKDVGESVEDDVPPRRAGSTPAPAKPPAERALIPFPEKPGVTVGRTPSTADAEQLKQSGTTTMLFVLSDKSEAAAARAEAEERGFTVLPLVVTPETFKDASRIFARALANKKPLHIVDEQRIRVGFLSYVYLRQTEQRSDDVARVLARPLGLPDASTELSQQYWIASQTLFNANP